MKVSDLVLMNFDGELVFGKERTGDAAFCIHSEIINQEDVKSIAHAHPMYGKTFSALGKELLPISQDSCAFYERTAMFNDYDGVANGPDEGINIAKALADKDFVILQNHGILTTGSMVDTTVGISSTWKRLVNHNYLQKQLESQSQYLMKWHAQLEIMLQMTYLLLLACNQCLMFCGKKNQISLNDF